MCSVVCVCVQHISSVFYMTVGMSVISRLYSRGYMRVHSMHSLGLIPFIIQIVFRACSDF